MKLDYVGKKSEKEILAKARSFKGFVKNIDDSRYLKVIILWLYRHYCLFMSAKSI